MNPLGLSSGSLPRASADELIAAAAELGAGIVDLRWGKGHAWEPAGLTPFADAGITVAFVGVSVVLGEGAADLGGLPGQLRALLVGARDLPLKVFASAVLDDSGSTAWETARDQLRTLASVSDVRPLVETHHGYAGLAALDQLCAEFGCDALLDLGGFFRLTGGFADPDRFVATRAAAAQVKGFRPDDPGTHRRLDDLPEQAWTLLASVPPHAPITIESKSGTLVGDIAALRAWQAASARKN